MCIASLDEQDSQATLVGYVVAAQAGDRDAMDHIVVRFQSSIQAIAFRRLGNWDEALELTQEVFLQAFRRLSQLQSPEAFAGWVRQIAHRMAINRLTRQRMPVFVEQEVLESQQGVASAPIDSVVAEETRAQLHAGLARLGSLDRETLVAFYFHGQTLIEMSDRFEAPIGTIKRRLHVARKRLAEMVHVDQAI